MPLCYEQNFRVFHFESDPWDRMTPGAVLRRAQDIATKHCESLGIGSALYQRTHTVFLLSKVSLEVNRMPGLEEPVRMQTRACGMRRAVYHRVTSLHDEAGNKLCEVDGRWVLVDTNTWHILRRPLPEFLPHFNGTPGYEEHDLAMPKPGPLFRLEEMRATYSVCDRNGHVNNSRYADFVCDHLPVEQLKAAPPRKMLFLYRSEIAMDTSFSLMGATAGENGYYFLGEQQGVKNFESHVAF